MNRSRKASLSPHLRNCLRKTKLGIVEKQWDGSMLLHSDLSFSLIYVAELAMSLPCLEPLKTPYSWSCVEDPRSSSSLPKGTLFLGTASL